MRHAHKILAACCLVAVVGWSATASGALVSHYTFDDAADLGADAAGLNDGTPVGDASQGPGVIGAGSLVLDGDGDYVDVGGNADFEAVDDDGDGWTLAAWVKTPGEVNNGVERIFSTNMPGGWAGGGWGAGFRQDRGSDEFISTTYGVVDMQNPTSVLDDAWHHVAYVFRNDAGSIATDYYVGGSLVGTDAPGNAFGITGTANGYAIGTLGLPTALQYFNGSIDDLRVYDTELTADEIGGLVPEPGAATLIVLGSLLFAGVTRRST